MRRDSRVHGVLAAACHYALDHNVDRLAQDHENAKRLARGLARCRGVALDVDAVETNIVIFRVTEETLAAALADRMRAEKVLILPVSRTAFRAVTHLDVSGDAIGAALAAFERVLGPAEVAA